MATSPPLRRILALDTAGPNAMHVGVPPHGMPQKILPIASSLKALSHHAPGMAPRGFRTQSDRDLAPITPDIGKTGLIGLLIQLMPGVPSEQLRSLVLFLYSGKLSQFSGWPKRVKGSEISSTFGARDVVASGDPLVRNSS